MFSLEEWLSDVTKRGGGPDQGVESHISGIQIRGGGGGGGWFDENYQI